MKYATLIGAAALVGLQFTAPASAQQLILGAGYSDFSQGSALDTNRISLEYIAAPFKDYGKLSLALGGIVTYDDESNSFVAAGISGTYDFNDRWFTELSFMPGFYSEGTPQNDLGKNLEFRTNLALGYNLTDTSAISLAIDHLSNAGLSSQNPGVNTLSLRYHFNF